MLNSVGANGQIFQNQDFGAAYCRAVNEWLVATWTSQEKRLKGSIVVPYEDAGRGRGRDRALGRRIRISCRSSC